MKKVAGRLRLDLAQFRELEAFAEFGSDLDKASQAQLDRGARVVEILKQKQYSPYPVQDQVISIFAVTNGYLDDLPIKSVADFERGLLDHMSSRHSDIGEAINESGKLEEDLEKRLREAIDEFKSSFTEQVETVETVAAEEGVPDVSDTPAAESGDAASQSADQAEEAEEDTSEQGTSSDSDDGESSEDRKEG